MNRRPSTLVRLVLLLTLAAGTAQQVGCTSDPQVINQAQNIHTELQPAVVRDQELAAYAQQIGDRIVEAAMQMRREGRLRGTEDWMFEGIQIHMVASPQLNAFTTGGKHIYMYTALFEQSETEDAFAAVVGHEFGHIVGRHVQRSMDRQMGVLAAAGVAGIIGGAVVDDNRLETGVAVAGVTAAAGQFFGMGFGRENEREADDLGFQFFVAAGYDPERFPDFFRNMIDQGYDTNPQLLSSHPSLASRVQAAEERVRNLPPEAERYRRPPIAEGQAYARLQERSQRATREAQQQAGRNPALARAKQLLAAFPSCVPGDAEGDVQREDPNERPEVSSDASTSGLHARAAHTPGCGCFN